MSDGDESTKQQPRKSGINPVIVVFIVSFIFVCLGCVYYYKNVYNTRIA